MVHLLVLRKKYLHELVVLHLVQIWHYLYLVFLSREHRQVVVVSSSKNSLQPFFPSYVYVGTHLVRMLLGHHSVHSKEFGQGMDLSFYQLGTISNSLLVHLQPLHPSGTLYHRWSMVVHLLVPAERTHPVLFLVQWKNLVLSYPLVIRHHR